MILDGGDGDEQSVGDLAVAETCDDQRRDFEFAVGERIEPGIGSRGDEGDRLAAGPINRNSGGTLRELNNLGQREVSRPVSEST